MRIFVQYKSTGEIISVSKVEVMPENLDQPYTGLEPGVAVMELPAKDEYQKASPLDLHTKYRVDVAKKKLVKKG